MLFHIQQELRVRYAIKKFNEECWCSIEDNEGWAHPMCEECYDIYTRERTLELIRRNYIE